MNDDLVTAAVFGDNTQAVAARLHLEAAGIPAFLADETVAGSIFLWSPAVGGIKLQVPESRLEEALRSLDERTPGDEGAINWTEVDVGLPESEGETEDLTENDIPKSHAVAETTPVSAPDELTLREQQAEWLLRCWILGLLVFPIMIFVWWQLVWVFASNERLRPEYRRKARLAAAFILPATVMWVVLGVVCFGAVR